MGISGIADVRRAEKPSKEAGADKTQSGKKSPFSLWVLPDQNLIQALQRASLVSQNDLTNTLNHLNFSERSLLVNLCHPRYEESILVRALPGPCLGSELSCKWSDESHNGLNLAHYEFLHLVIDDGQSMILVPGRLQDIDDDGFTIQLPEKSYAVWRRNRRRYACREVVVELIQSGFQATGELLDFSGVCFRVKVKPDPFCSFHWFNSDAVVTIHLRSNQQILFSGLCRCIRQKECFSSREIVLAPVGEKINRFKRKPIRNTRQHLVPSPAVVFEHPLFGKRIQMEVQNISTSGFSVYEKPDEGVLIPGMIIPDLTITYAGALSMKCTAQVIYRLKEKKYVRCGLAILDMDINTYSRLTHILANALDPHAYVSSDVDVDSLWEFFFETGFIYPTKYRLIQSHREEFKQTYQRLYHENAEIAKSFTYQRNGRIYGHISMVRAYERAWMIHHHAGKAMGNKRTGFAVLKQIMHCLHDMCRLPSARMDYVMSYFRPENRFPNLVFGGFASDLNDLRGCSMDLFSYLAYTSLSLKTELPVGWSLQECSPLDLWELNHFYSHYSGGLLIHAIGLGQTESNGGSLEEVYRRIGFLRKWNVYSLTYEGELYAVLIVSQSNLGFNLSELLNGIKVLVTMPEGLPWSVLSVAIAQLTSAYQMERVPILFYPFDYVKAQDIPYEKQYLLWILNVQYGDDYMDFMYRKFRLSEK